MITLLPYAEFDDCARCLTSKRLGKQCTEAVQILDSLTGFSAAWQKHPCTKMWKGHEQALFRYALTCCMEWYLRHGSHRLEYYSLEVSKDAIPALLYEWQRPPEWLNDRRLHMSHRAALLRENPEWYSTYFKPEDTPDVPLWWPVN